MESTDVSRSARMVALLRALHQRLPAESRIHHDAFAARLIAGPRGRRVLNSPLLSRLVEFLRPGASAQIAARDHFADGWARRTLSSEGSSGGQVLLVGAGFDSMTLRLGESFPAVQFFEIDLPTTQGAKIALLTGQNLVPPRCRFVSADFTDTTDLAALLTGAGFEPARTTFANWMGVSYYLPRAAIERMLATFDQLLSPGSVVALDYMETAVIKKRSIWRGLLRRGGETFQTSFSQAELTSLAAAHHFEIAEFSSTLALASQFFQTRRPPRQPMSFAALRKAAIG